MSFVRRIKAVLFYFLAKPVLSCIKAFLSLLRLLFLLHLPLIYLPHPQKRKKCIREPLHGINDMTTVWGFEAPLDVCMRCSQAWLNVRELSVFGHFLCYQPMLHCAKKKGEMLLGFVIKLFIYFWNLNWNVAGNGYSFISGYLTVVFLGQAISLKEKLTLCLWGAGATTTWNQVWFLF